MISVRASMFPRSLDCMRAAASAQFSDLIEEAGFPLAEKRIGIYTAVGSGTHKAINDLLTYKIENGELPANVDEVVEAGIMEYRASLQKYSEIVYDSATPTQDSGIYQINSMTRAFYQYIAPRLSFPDGADPRKHLEMYLKTRIGDDAELSGHIDIRTTLSLVDTKSGKILRPCHTQLGGYGNLLTANGYDKPENLIAAHLPRVNTDKAQPSPSFESYPVNFCLNESWYLVNQIIRDVKNFISSGNPACFQANPQSTLCSPKYCRCHGTKFCSYYK